MEIGTIQIILVFLVACVAGMGSILDEFQTHQPLIACTLIGLVLGDISRCYDWCFTSINRIRLDEHRCSCCT